MPGERSQEEWEELIKHHESIADADLTSVMEHDQYQHEQDLPQYIDHTLLKLDANQAQIDQLCEEAKEHSFKVGASILLLSFHLIIGEIDTVSIFSSPSRVVSSFYLLDIIRRDHMLCSFVRSLNGIHSALQMRRSQNDVKLNHPNEDLN